MGGDDCGDGRCTGDETYASCPSDCFLPELGGGNRCGDRLCTGSETHASCPDDCEPSPEGGDRCGDRVCSGPEDFFSCPADCQPPLSDRDGDGLPDIWDLCPDLDARTVDPSRIVDGNHIDEDGDFWGDDCVPTGCAGACSPDSDGDGWLDCEDNCADTFNPDQADCDGNGVGDACEPDSDGDGVPDPCDSCPTVSNPPIGERGQPNCNADAEIAAGLLGPSGFPPGVGDACDPTPCGDTMLETRVGEGTVLGRPSRVASRSVINVDGRSTEAQRARTGFRFCRCEPQRSDDDDDVLLEHEEDSVAVRIECALSQDFGCVIDDRREYDRALAAGADEREFRWRWPSVDNGSTAAVEGPLAEHAVDYRWTESHPAFQPSFVGEWNLESDGSRWAALFGDPAGFLSVSLPGVLWTHTPGPVSSSAGARPNFPDEVRALAHHYWNGVATRTEAARPFPCMQYVAPLSPSGCTFCSGSFPSSYLALPFLDARCLGAPERPQLALPGFPLDPRPYLPFDFDAVFGPALASPQVEWLAPSEPREWLPNIGVRLVGLDSTRAPVVQIVQTSQGLELVSPGQACGPNGCGPCVSNACGPLSFGHVTAPVAPTNVVTPDGPPMARSSAPTEGRSVLSARREVLWTVRGDRSTRAGELSVRRLSSTEASTSPLALGDVLAATYDPARDALYVLDEVERGSGWRRFRTARLVRVSVASSEASAAAHEVEVLAEWPRLSLNERFALSADGSGALWLVASPSSSFPLAAHVAVRLAEDGRARWGVAGIHLGAGRLANVTVTSDLRGVSYITEDRSGVQASTGLRVDALRSLRVGELARCF